MIKRRSSKDRVVDDLSLWLFLLSAAFALFYFANMRARIYFHAPNYGFVGAVALYLFVTALGLLARRRWAIILMSAPCLVVGALLVSSTLQPHRPLSFADLFYNLCFEALLAFAFAITAKRWRHWSW